MPRLSASNIYVVTRPGCRKRGLLRFGPAFSGRAVPVALGRTGIRADKREGDGATPRGCFRPVRLWWRADRALLPATALPARPIRRSDGWCEDVRDRRYNQPIRLEAGAVGDRLWRDDHLYDFIIELDHNTHPRIAGRGSAVFIHCAREGLGPTAGCVALSRNTLRRLIGFVSPKTRIWIQ